jgi:uncharacterized protein YjiS (DUF1127 family)
MIRTKTFWSRMIAFNRRRAMRRKLQQLDDRMLHDIGIARSEIDYVIETELRRTQHFDF